MRRSNQVVIVDYGLGNLFSIQRALTRIGTPSNITSDTEAIQVAPAAILPGVGAFGDGVQRLRERGLFESMLHFAQSGRPLLGICLGMQLLFKESEEFGSHLGLGLIPGQVKRIHNTDPSGRRVKVPLIGWNELRQPQSVDSWGSTILEGLVDGDAVYFVHSYVPYPEAESISVAEVNYGGYSYCAVAQKNNFVGLQFHPEKSGEVGLHVLQNFVQQLSG